ncbi:DUF3558 domain-containing protein [Actinopolyspora sp. H202]|uniref:DUF3558 domain-containing protein n=1 Tax=Actinopolyspora sp. H202 TaxID=1500456 RepID=UPI003EE4D1DC
MENLTHKARRSTVIAGVLTLAIALSACSSNSTGQTGTPEETATSSTGSSASQSGSGITNPKNPAALEPCELLPNEATATLGVGTKGEREPNDLKPNLSDICTWEGEETDSKEVALVAFQGRTIQQYYDNKSNYGYFKKLEVSGHPAVIGNTKNPTKSSSCTIYMAANENQIVMSHTFISTENIGKTNPCDLARRALKLSLPSWPAAK